MSRSSTSEAPLLRAEGLTKDYGTFRALDGLRLDIAPGEVFGLLGPNGSGKSTAIRLMLGFLQPTCGTIRVADFDPWTQGVDVRRRVAYLPGELRLYENMTGRRLIRFLMELRRESIGESDVDSLARTFDVDVDRPLTQMSSGMKRKVALLAILTPRVPMIILDEPTNTLDPVMRDQLLVMLQKAKERGQAVLFSSHVLSEVERVCDRVGILRHGKLVHLQSMADLREGKFLRARFARPPSAGPKDSALPADCRRADGTFEMAYRGPLGELLKWLHEQAVLDVSLEPLGLEPIYRRFHGNEA